MTTKAKVNKAALKKSNDRESYEAAGGAILDGDNWRILEQLVRREVVQNVSLLVSQLAKHPECLRDSGYEEEDICGICTQDDWESAVREHDDFISAEEEYGETYIKLKGRDDNDQLTDWREAAEALGIDDPQTYEAYEHWIVSDWFANKLKQHGEITGEVLGLTIWGRCTTGQSITMDGVIGSIAAEMQILVGQENDWSKQK